MMMMMMMISYRRQVIPISLRLRRYAAQHVHERSWNCTTFRFLVAHTHYLPLADIQRWPCPLTRPGLFQPTAGSVLFRRSVAAVLFRGQFGRLGRIFFLPIFMNDILELYSFISFFLMPHLIEIHSQKRTPNFICVCVCLCVCVCVCNNYSKKSHVMFVISSDIIIIIIIISYYYYYYLVCISLVFS